MGYISISVLTTKLSSYTGGEKATLPDCLPVERPLRKISGAETIKTDGQLKEVISEKQGFRPKDGCSTRSCLREESRRSLIRRVKHPGSCIQYLPHKGSANSTCARRTVINKLQVLITFGVILKSICNRNIIVLSSSNSELIIDLRNEYYLIFISNSFVSES